jgi:hypothetical protein
MLDRTPGSIGMQDVGEMSDSILYRLNRAYRYPCLNPATRHVACTCSPIQSPTGLSTTSTPHTAASEIGKCNPVTSPVLGLSTVRSANQMSRRHADHRTRADDPPNYPAKEPLATPDCHPTPHKSIASALGEARVDHRGRLYRRGYAVEMRAIKDGSGFESTEGI